MPALGPTDLRALEEERRLLDEITALARRCAGQVPVLMLDGVLLRSSVRIPAPRSGRSCTPS